MQARPRFQPANMGCGSKCQMKATGTVSKPARTMTCAKSTRTGVGCHRRIKKRNEREGRRRRSRRPETFQHLVLFGGGRVTR